MVEAKVSLQIMLSSVVFLLFFRQNAGKTCNFSLYRRRQEASNCDISNNVYSVPSVQSYITLVDWSKLSRSFLTPEKMLLVSPLRAFQD